LLALHCCYSLRPCIVVVHSCLVLLFPPCIAHSRLIIVHSCLVLLLLTLVVATHLELLLLV
jgi:hypothetical protein